MKNIKTEHKRHLKNNYMIISYGGELEDILSVYRHEYRMLESNNIDGLMKLHINRTDSEAKLYYDITALQPLSRILEFRHIGAEEIRNIVFNIVKTISGMCRYLLSEEGISISPDYIYADPETLKLSLCYMPGLESGFCENLSELFSNLLSKIDHNDHEGVVLAYSLYQESLKEDYSTEDLLALLSRYGKTVSVEYKEINEEAGEDYENEKKYIPVNLLRENTGAREGKRSVKKDLFNFRNFFAKKLKAKQDIGRFEYGLNNTNVIYEVNKAETKAGLKSENISEAFNEDEEWTAYFEKKDNEEKSRQNMQEAGSRTILLSKQPDNERAKLCCTDKSAEDIKLEYFPFIIGSQERVCDYVLHTDKISRLHLKLDKNEDKKYTVMDLNSLYGTKLNGRLLESEECSVLNMGDEIEFAGIKYTFGI